MAEPYLERLTSTLEALRILKSRRVRLECRHFFSGAALYVNGNICATLTPKGFAVKLSEPDRLRLFQTRQGRRLRYFKNGPVKKEYVVLGRALKSNAGRMRSVLRESIKYVTA